MEARHWSIAIPAFRATTDVDPRASPPDIARRPRRPPHRPSPCTSSPRRCHKTSAFPAAAPKDRTDSAPHANRAARRTAAAAHTNRHYQQAAIRSRAGIHSSSPRAVHIQAPHDQTVTPARAERDSGRRQCKISFVLNRRRRYHKRIARHPQRPRIRRIERTALHRRGVLQATRPVRAACPSFRAAARRPTETHWHPPTDRSANRARKHRRQKQKAHTIAAAEERQKG